MDEAKKCEQEQAIREQEALEMEMKDKSEDRKVKLALEVEALKIKRNPPVTGSWSTKLENPGPDFMTEIVNQNGMSVDNEKMLADIATGGLLKQAAKDLEQEHFNERAPAETVKVGVKTKGKKIAQQP